MSAEVREIEVVDLSDLDLLDDASAHARCTLCFPGDVTLVSIVALCGTVAIQRTTGGSPDAEPVNACGECRVLWDQPCTRCGR